MFNRLAGLLLSIGLILAFAQGQAAEASDQTMVGAWKLVEFTQVGQAKTSQPQPSLWIFSQKHYSLAFIFGTKARTQDAPGAQLTDAEKAAMYDPFVANSGTYSVSGNMLTTVPIVSKTQSAMTNGYLLTYEMKFEGNDTVSLTTKVGRGVNSVWKLRRLE
jgi:hypothetical protein